jgi:hypothetical protein
LLLSQVVQSMSDIPATALWTLAVLAAMAGRPFVAAASSGLAIAIRPSLLPLAGVVALLLAIWPARSLTSLRASLGAFVKYAFATVPAVAALAWIQWSLYGNPLTSGHGTFAEMFAITNVLPNIRAYAMRVLTGETPALVLIAASIVALIVKRRIPANRTSEAGPAPVPPAVVPSMCLAVFMAIPVLACYLAYTVFTDWAYLRFLLPLWPAALAVAGGVVANATRRLPAAVRTQVLLVALTAVCARNVMTAAHEGTFTLWADASRYGTAGRYLDATLPASAVIVTSEHSGSASYYTGHPILRWDSLHTGLDEAIAELVKLGRSPVIVVESWEEAPLRQQFPASSLARLDWTARAEFGSVTRVRLFDPADRERPTGRPPDRLP